MTKVEERNKRECALQRAEELESRISPYLDAKGKILTGFDLQEQHQKLKSKILEYYKATEEQWNDWHWQMKNRIEDVETLGKLIDLSHEQKQIIEKIEKECRWSISPYYLSILDPNDPSCPVWMQAIPSEHEIDDPYGKEDPMAEEYTSPAPRITRRYPDRLIINITNQCAMFCRHCQRRRNIGEIDKPAPKKDIEEAINYIRNNPEIRDVLVTGGDPLTLSDDKLEWILSEIRSIPSVEIIRLGSRTLVALPQRITQKLCDMLEKYHPIYINTHFNHPREITPDTLRAAKMLAKAGIALGNQAVLLRNINNNPNVMKKLNHELLKIHVRPYYIFHAKSVKGTSHFVTRIEDGLEIMEQLRGYTSGMAIPWYIINAPDGHGKTPILPQYLISQGRGHVLIRNWEGKVFKYPNGHEE